MTFCKLKCSLWAWGISEQTALLHHLPCWGCLDKKSKACCGFSVQTFSPGWKRWAVKVWKGHACNGGALTDWGCACLELRQSPKDPEEGAGEHRTLSNLKATVKVPALDFYETVWPIPGFRSRTGVYVLESEIPSSDTETFTVIPHPPPHPLHACNFHSSWSFPGVLSVRDWKQPDLFSGEFSKSGLKSFPRLTHW